MKMTKLIIKETNSKPWNFGKKIISHINIYFKELLEISKIR